jgi:hypothetical protein
MRDIRIANAMQNALDTRITRVAPDVRSVLHSMGYVLVSTVYIKSCSHEVAKHKSGEICQFHLTAPPSATTLRKMVMQSVRMGNAHAGSLRTRRRQYTNPMSKVPKHSSQIKVQKIFKILVKLGLIIYTQMGSLGWHQEKDSGFTPLAHLPSDPLVAAHCSSLSRSRSQKRHSGISLLFPVPYTAFVASLGTLESAH